VCISEGYLACVKSGLIDVRKGLVRVTTTARNGCRAPVAVFSDGSEAEFDLVICATGYRAHLPFICPEISLQVQFEPTDLLQPLILYESVFPPKISNLAFVGMYRGPYLAAIELQAKWVARVFSGKLPLPSRKEMEREIAREEGIRLQRPRPQFPRADYVEMCLGLARKIGCRRELERVESIFA